MHAPESWVDSGQIDEVITSTSTDGARHFYNRSPHLIELFRVLGNGAQTIKSEKCNQQQHLREFLPGCKFLSGPGI